ncbi:hypothetical protein [Budvicia aquatica]|nr:hypothetical protein [Budvicia aquatica]
MLFRCIEGSSFEFLYQHRQQIFADGAIKDREPHAGTLSRKIAGVIPV